jgi:beta-phosphoglucomutase-like phosphatase (HAD superfamily)
MGSVAAAKFMAPPEQVTFAALLFDMDGTIIDSTDAVVKHWHRYVWAFWRFLILELYLHCSCHL